MIYIPTIEESVMNQWLCHYTHFNERLNERYNMDITFQEYKDLCKMPIAVIKKISKNKSIGVLEIKGVKVMVAKETSRKRVLSTALWQNQQVSNKNQSK